MQKKNLYSTSKKLLAYYFCSRSCFSR